MKVRSISCRHFSTTFGSNEIFMPNSSKTSADPLFPDAALFPCLATGIPYDATTIADAVDILNHFNPLPPVPHTSIAFSLPFIFIENSLITAAIPAISSNVSPLIARLAIITPN